MAGPVRGAVVRGQAGRTTEQPPLRVLFLCTQNAARSQIAEALLIKKGGDRFVVASAGTAPAASVHAGAVAALRTAGIEWTSHYPKSLEAVANEPWDIVITLCDRALEGCPALPSRPVTAHWGIPDPAVVAITSGRGTSAFDDALTLLVRRIDLLLSLRPELLDRLILEERLRAIGRTSVQTSDTEQQPGGAGAGTEGPSLHLHSEGDTDRQGSE